MCVIYPCNSIPNKDDDNKDGQPHEMSASEAAVRFGGRSECLLVPLDVRDAVLAVAEAFGRLVAAQPLDERVRRAADPLRERDDVDALQDDVVRHHRVRVGERRAEQHNVYIAALAHLWDYGTRGF